MRRLMGLVCGLSLLATAASAETWVGTWAAPPVTPSPPGGPPQFSTPSFSNQTIRQVVRISAGGKRVRVRLSNAYGTAPLAIGAARIALPGEKGQIKPGSEKTLTFGGKPATVIPVGSPMLSDPVDLPVEALASLTVTVYLPGETGPCTCHGAAMATTFIAAGDQVGAAAFPTTTTSLARAFLAGVEVETAAPTKVIVTFGDSITDGVGSTLDANKRWPDLLADRLVARNRKQPWAVVNMGISGNRVLSESAGQSALARFDRDVLATPGAAYVVIFEGVNDLGVSYGRAPFPGVTSSGKVTADDLTGGYRQMIERAHAKGIKVIGATIAPFEGASYWTAEGEAVRQAVNTWIRESKAFDGVIDFDAVVRDPAKPSQMKEGFHAGDHLHGSDTGYKAMAEAINLGLFK